MKASKGSKERYVRIPRPYKSKSILKKGSNLFANLISIHKRSIAREKNKLGLSEYGLMWIAFFRGVFLTVIVERLIFH